MGRLEFNCRHRHPSGFGLDAAFDAGDGVTALFGPSGGGKTTTLSLVAGLLRPHAGSIRLGGRVLADAAAGAFVPPERRGVGLVFQDHLLFPHLSVEANLRYGLRRRPARPIDFDRVVQVLELRDLLGRAPHTLSGGQRQRVALGRAVLRGPELLLMDEPLAGLEEALKDRVLGYLERAVAEWKIPTLLVSHDQSDVRRLAERVVVLEAGRVVDAGPTAATLDRAVTVSMRSRPGPVNLLRVDEVKTVGGHREGRLGGQTFYLPAAEGDNAGGAGPAFVQFLPSDVTLARRGADVAGLSARNHLLGRVRDVVAADGRVFVAVDLGPGASPAASLWAEVTHDAVRELELRAGAGVTCLIKTSALRLVG